MLDSDQRVSAAEALAHAYFSQYHDPDYEPEAEPYDESVEAKERTVEEWKGGAASPRRGGRGALGGGVEGWGRVPEAGLGHSQRGLLFLREGLGVGPSTPPTLGRAGAARARPG